MNNSKLNYKLPSRQEALQLLLKSGCEPNVIEHCKAVARLAVKIAKELQNDGFRVNVELVEIGALLHDIGRSKTHTVHHAIIGAKIAREAGLPNSVIKIIERHVGGGITAKEAEKLGWPIKDYIPKTMEEKIVCYADKLIEGRRQVPIERTIKQLAAELGSNHPAVKRVKKLHEEFSSMVKLRW